VHGPIHVRAVARPPNTYYRMDAEIAPGKPLAWPVGDVLRPAQLSAERIGLFGWVETAEGRVFIPLRAASVGAPPSTNGVVLELRSPRTLEVALWRAKPRGQTSGGSTEWHEAGRRLAAGVPIVVPIPEGPPEVLQLTVQAKVEGYADWATLEILVQRDAP